MTTTNGQHRRHDRGVSPVIGVILMVAVTVVLAAVIGTFVLDLGGLAGTDPPSASISATADTTTGNLTLRHRGGDRLDASRTRIVVRDAETAADSTWEPRTGRLLLVAGGTARINLSADNVDWDGDGSYDYEAAGGALAALEAGTEYTVSLIDVPTGRLFVETRVLA